MRSTQFNRKGFTLLELLMVVIIIAILASLALPQYFRATERTRSGQVMQLLASIRGAEMRFRANSPTNVYDNSAGLAGLGLPLPPLPATWANIVATGNGPGSNITVTRNGGNNGGALLEIDLDNGMVCASNAQAGNDWGLPGAGC